MSCSSLTMSCSSSNSPPHACASDRSVFQAEMAVARRSWRPRLHHQVHVQTLRDGVLEFLEEGAEHVHARPTRLASSLDEGPRVRVLAVLDVLELAEDRGGGACPDVAQLLRLVGEFQLGEDLVEERLGAREEFIKGLLDPRHCPLDPCPPACRGSCPRCPDVGFVTLGLLK